MSLATRAFTALHSSQSARVQTMKGYLLAICLPLVLTLGSTARGAQYSESNPPPKGSPYVRPVTDYTSLIDNLRAAGVSVEPEGEVDQPFLSVKGRILKVSGEHVQVFQYANAAAADAQGARVSRDGSSVGTSKIHWIGPPHFYKKEKLLVLYIGDNDKVLKVLEAVLGRQFAGQ